MKLIFDRKLANNYKNQSQKIRILTEDWVDNHIFCPNCGHLSIDKYPNNKPVADFYCSKCYENYELKSKHESIGARIVDGAYKTMMECLRGNKNPNLFLLTYNLFNFSVQNFLVIPKHFFIPEIIERRKPLTQTARRAGWVGCNILLKTIPVAGKIFFIRNEKIEPKEKVLKNWQKTLFLREEKEISVKGWTLDIMRCIDELKKQEFSLDEIYVFENKLSKNHPDNRHIKDKIRQQLQILRDKNYIEFIDKGRYRLL